MFLFVYVLKTSLLMLIFCCYLLLNWKLSRLMTKHQRPNSYSNLYDTSRLTELKSVHEEHFCSDPDNFLDGDKKFFTGVTAICVGHGYNTTIILWQQDNSVWSFLRAIFLCNLRVWKNIELFLWDRSWNMWECGKRQAKLAKANEK